MARADRDDPFAAELAALIEAGEIDPAAGRSWRLLRAEAAALADALTRHWDTPNPEHKLGTLLPANTATELRALASALGAAVNDHALAVDLIDGEAVPCAEHVFAELIAALCFAGAAAEEIRRAAERLHQQRLRDADGAGPLAARLASCLRLASAARPQLERVPGFDAGLIAEGAALVDELGAQASRRPASLEAAHALTRRDALATLLARRLGQARRAAWFVFRNDREILRDFPSPYERPPV
jgi:hypothetical protein